MACACAGSIAGARCGDLHDLHDLNALSYLSDLTRRTDLNGRTGLTDLENLMIITVCNLKGGTSKTTSAAFLAHALAERGLRVLVVDADPQCSITRWAELAEWSIPVRGMAHGRLHVPETGVALEAAGHDAVVIDTPPSERERGIVESAIRAATHVVVPVAPTTAEFERMGAVRELIEDVSHLGRHGAPPVAAALLTRTVASSSSPGIYRELLTRAGWAVMPGSVAHWQRFAQAWGQPVDDAAGTAYGDAVRFLGLARVAA